MTNHHRGDAPVDDKALAEIEGLLGQVGWARAGVMIGAVAGVHHPEMLSTMTHREYATVRIALRVLAETA